MNLPRLRKKIRDFFIDEKGSVNKDKLLKASVAVASIVISANSVVAGHSNTHNNGCGFTQSPKDVTVYQHSNTISQPVLSNGKLSVSHSHCSDHNSHSSHSSHGHGLWG